MALVSIIMGSQSDYKTMYEAEKILEELDISYEVKIVSAHRTPERMFKFAQEAEQKDIKVIIAGAGGAAHLPGMVAALTTIPVIGVPVKSKALKGMDSLLSIAQMPGGIPVATMSIGESGAKNAGLMAASICSTFNEKVKTNLKQYRQKQTQSVKDVPVIDFDV